MASPILVAEGAFTPGAATTLMGDSPSTEYSAVFEDDGETAYFYGLDTRQADQPILDALHIYNVRDVSDRQRSSLGQIVWSADGLQVALLINGYPHAAFNFGAQRGYCRTGFPPPSGRFSSEGHAWSDDAVNFLRNERP
jgi:hypothetical protein